MRDVAGSSADAALDSERINRLIEAIQADRSAGVPIDEQTISERYPELRPGLERALEYVRRVEAAALDAEPDVLDAAAEEELRFLNEKLPAYDVLERVSYGGQGIVYRAVQRATGRHVAIKLLLHGGMATLREQDRFGREVEILARFDHPNIVTVYESGKIERRNYVVMKLIEGVPIETHIFVRRLTVRQIVALFIPVCRAIEYAHQRSVIHRDIKPDNILIDTDGQAHVLDFGLAKDTRGIRRTFMTACGERLGTPAFFSPEQASEQENEVDTRSDIYSLGVTLFKLITETFPYSISDDLAATRRVICEQSPVRMAAVVTSRRQGVGELNDDLEQIVRRALAKEKDRRYASAGALADDLERYLRRDAVTAKADSPSYLLRKTVRRYRRPLAVICFLFVMSIASTVLIAVAWNRAELERARSNRTARMSHGLLDGVVGIVDDRVASLPGGKVVREEIMDTLAAHLPEILASISDDAGMQDIEAAVHLKQGDIAQQRGRLEEAQDHYRAAISLAEPNSVQLVRAYRKLGFVSDGFDKAFREAIRTAQQLPADEPAGIYERIESHLEYEQKLFWLGRTGEAETQVEEALQLLKRQPINASDMRGQRLLARAHLMRGNLDAQLGRLDDAIASSREALEVRRALSEAEPANVDARHVLLASCQWLGDLRLRRGEKDEALALYEEACRIGRDLIEADPGVMPWMREYYGSLARRANVLIETGRFDLAEAVLVEATPIAEELSAIRMADDMGRRILGTHRIIVGNWHYAQEEVEQALAAYNDGLTIRMALSAESVAAPDLDAELASAHDRVAKCNRRLGRLLAAREHCERALRIRQLLLNAQPESTQRAFQMAVSYTTLVQVHLDAHDYGAAASTIEAAQTLVDDRLASLRSSDADVEGLLALLDGYRAKLRAGEQASHAGGPRY